MRYSATEATIPHTGAGAAIIYTPATALTQHGSKWYRTRNVKPQSQGTPCRSSAEASRVTSKLLQG